MMRGNPIGSQLSNGSLISAIGAMLTPNPALWDAIASLPCCVYGIMAYTVSQRTPEIGVRMAVGASPNRVVAMVVWQGARLAVMGVVLGMIAAALAAGAMQTLLFDVKGIDPFTFAVAPIFLAVAAILAVLAGFDVTAGEVSAFDFLCFAVAALAVHLIYPIAIRR